MGNWLGKKAQVQPRAQPRPHVRVKVRMTRTQLRKLMSRVDPSRGYGELGPLILRECLEGRLLAPVVLAGDRGKREKQLSTITEET
ncbi:hypothetical protein EUGRSUZ_H01935 [Eucalyptus grandis]|uniref:Uncharacterized protein n=2 Tax=Eucalyptus grandis TaxID=71139 RepID=A0ACC3JPU0_EUCGR|nr:hypothetical protein EUGRSUZ_H01935 [Eucalyptus grandis]